MNDSKSWDFLGSWRAGKHAKNYNQRIADSFGLKIGLKISSWVLLRKNCISVCLVWEGRTFLRYFLSSLEARKDLLKLSTCISWVSLSRLLWELDINANNISTAYWGQMILCRSSIVVAIRGNSVCFARSKQRILSATSLVKARRPDCLLVHTTPDRAFQLGSGRGRGPCVVFLHKTLHSSVRPLSTQVYKWVPANFRGNPAMDYELQTDRPTRLACRPNLTSTFSLPGSFVKNSRSVILWVAIYGRNGIN